MSNCNKTRYLNEQTYLKTVCQDDKPKPKPKCHCDKPYVEYTCCSRQGKVTFRCDEDCVGVSVNVKKNKKDD